MPRTYRYIGDAAHLAAGPSAPHRQHVTGPADVRNWVEETRQELDAAREVTTTFIIDDDGQLWIADRHSEHVQCARGGDVLSAGEMTFQVRRDALSVTGITNQSTGYCPEPDSWPAVQTALYRAALPHPGGFSTAFVFRRCPKCRATNLIKEGWMECGVCAAALPERWNFDTAP